MHDYAATEVGADYGTGIAERSAIEFAVADGHDFADGVHDGFSGGERELLEFGRGLGQLAGERDFAALEEWGVVEVEAARTSPVAGAGESQVLESPAKWDAK